MCHLTLVRDDLSSITGCREWRQAIERLMAQTALAALRWITEIDMGMPLSDAQRNALAQLVFTHACRPMIFT